MTRRIITTERANRIIFIHLREALPLEARAIVFFVMMVMMVMVRMIIRHTHYFKMLNNNDATETSMLVDVSHSVVV